MQRSNATTKAPRPIRNVFEPDPARRKILTVPNMISVGRIFLLIPLFIFLRQGPEAHGNFWALVIMGAALFTDILDGLVARWFHAESDWGRVLDPLADKTWLGCLTLFLAMPWREHPLPWEFVAFILFRDISIVTAGYIAYRKSGHVMTSDFLGKIAMGLVAATLISYTVYWVPEFAPWAKPENLLTAAAAMMFISGGNYTYRFIRVLRRAGLERRMKDEG